MYIEAIIRFKDTEEVAERLFKIGDSSDEADDENVFFFIGSENEMYGEFDDFEIINWDYVTV